MRHLLHFFQLLLVLLLASAPLALSQTSSHGIDLTDLDRKTEPCTDFFQFANGTWRANHPIPASMTRWSKRWQSGESAKDRLHDILEAASTDTNAPKGSSDEIIGDYYRAAPVVEQVVNHGDLALMNVLWDGEVVALLDFEFAVLGPVEIDLCRLVCEALVSEDGQRADNDAGDAFAIAARERDPVHGRALLLGAAVLDQLRDLEIWLGRDRTEDRFEDWRPDRLLTGLLETDGGYLEPALT